MQLFLAGPHLYTKTFAIMNRLSLYFLLIPAMFMAGCYGGNNDNYPCDMIWDLYPMNITFSAADADGNDLLDPESNLNILDKITVQYRNKTYTVGEKDESMHTRAYKPHWEGLSTEYSERHECYLLRIGEFGPDGGGHHNDKLTINWGDGTKDEITFDFYVTWSKCEPDVYSKFQVNGEKQTPFFFGKTFPN